MWDAELVTRIKERKLEELSVFAYMAKIDSASLDQYIDIMVSLGDDINACDTLMDTEGEAEIELDCIDDPSYTMRLSEEERADEDAFNALKTEPRGEITEETLQDYVRNLISEAVESLASVKGSNDEGMNVLKDELAACRDRIDVLSQQIEFSKAEAAEALDRIKELEEERAGLEKQISELKGQNSSLKSDLGIAEQKLSVLEPAYQEAIDKLQSIEPVSEPESVDEEIQPVEETVVTEEVPEQTQGKFLSEQNVETIRKVRTMKDSKIDAILDAYDDTNAQESDDIVDFLKTDIAICDAILNIDFTEKSSVISGFNQIIKVLSNSKDPENQDAYVNSLTAEEAQLEYNYSQVLNSLQAMIMYMKDDLDLE